MVQINVCISQSMDKFPGFEMCYLGDHHRQKRVGCDIERHAEKHVGRPLIKLSRQLAASYIKLEKQMTRWRRGFSTTYKILQVGDVPRGHYDSSSHRCAWILLQSLNLIYGGLNLIVGFTVVAFPGRPLFAVNRPELSLLICPLVPDAHAVIIEIFDVGIAAQEPQQFVNN